MEQPGSTPGAGIRMPQSKTIRIPTTVYEQAEAVADERDMTLKEAIRHMCQEAGYDV